MFGAVLASKWIGPIQRGESLSREGIWGGGGIIQKSLVARLNLYVAAIEIQSCLACQLALQHEAPRLACDQGHVLGEGGPPGLTIVVADRPRSHEGPAWVLVAIGVEWTVSMAECRRGIVDA